MFITHARTKYRNFDRKYSKENVHSDDIFSDRNNKNNIRRKSGAEYVD